MDTVENRVLQTIEYGSVFEALFQNFITSEDILKYLLDNKNPIEPRKTRINKLIAYRCVCIIDDEQIVRGKHFLLQTEDEMYTIIFTMTYCIYNSTKTGFVLNKNNLKVKQKIDSVLPKIYNEDISKLIYLICDTYIKDEFDEFDLSIIIEARSIRLISKYWDELTKNIYNFIYSDYVVPLFYMNQNIYNSDLIDRCSLLIDKAPLYWKYVGEKLYRLIMSTNINIKNPQLDKCEIELYESIFPGLFPKEILNSSELILKLKKYTDRWLSYILGYPIYLSNPPRNWNEEAIEKLNKIGIDGYSNYIIEKNKNILKSQLSFCENYKIVNELDSLMEKINDYNLTDVVYYIDNSLDGSKIFLFSKPEFKTLINNRKNFYNNSEFPDDFIKKIEHRIEETKDLPDSCPIKELLTKIIENKSLIKNILPDPLILVDSLPPVSRESVVDDGIDVRVINRETGIQSTMNMSGLDDIYEEDAINIIINILDERGFDFIGRCLNPHCDNISSDFEDYFSEN